MNYRKLKAVSAKTGLELVVQNRSQVCARTKRWTLGVNPKPLEQIERAQRMVELGGDLKIHEPDAIYAAAHSIIDNPTSDQLDVLVTLIEFGSPVHALEITGALAYEVGLDFDDFHPYLYPLKVLSGFDVFVGSGSNATKSFRSNIISLVHNYLLEISRAVSTIEIRNYLKDVLKVDVPNLLKYVNGALSVLETMGIVVKLPQQKIGDVHYAMCVHEEYRSGKSTIPLGNTDFLVLNFLVENGAQPVGAICKKTKLYGKDFGSKSGLDGISSAGIRKVLNRLERAGLVSHTWHKSKEGTVRIYYIDPSYEFDVSNLVTATKEGFLVEPLRRALLGMPQSLVVDPSSFERVVRHVRIIQLRDKQVPTRKIATSLGVSRGAVQHAIRRRVPTRRMGIRTMLRYSVAMKSRIGSSVNVGATEPITINPALVETFDGIIDNHILSI